MPPQPLITTLYHLLPESLASRANTGKQEVRMYLWLGNVYISTSGKRFSPRHPRTSSVNEWRGILLVPLLGELIHQLGRLVACRGRDYLGKTFSLIYNKLFAWLEGRRRRQTVGGQMTKGKNFLLFVVSAYQSNCFSLLTWIIKN